MKALDRWLPDSPASLAKVRAARKIVADLHDTTESFGYQKCTELAEHKTKNICSVNNEYYIYSAHSIQKF